MISLEAAYAQLLKAEARKAEVQRRARIRVDVDRVGDQASTWEGKRKSDVWIRFVLPKAEP